MIMASHRIPEAALAASSGDSEGNKPKGIPLIGFGTAAYPFKIDKVKQSVLNAIKVGYRHFDTASVYRAEEPLGEAIAEALGLGLIKSRDELFITSKLWCWDAHPHLVVPSIRETVKNLGLEYVDLYLIHWPIAHKPGKYESEIQMEDLLPLDFKGVWEAMEECNKQGLAKYIGVSNFTSKKLQRILDNAQIPPAVNQVEMNPFWRQEKLREFCKEKGIHITAFSPLGAAGMPWGGNNVLDSDILKERAQAKGKTVAQVCLRWAYEQGVSVIVKSFHEKRMKENLEIFDWKLSQEDLAKIEQIPQKRALVNLFISENGPYRTIEEMWDDEGI